VEAECPNRARSVLCGGRSVMGVPTAIPNRNVTYGGDQEMAWVDIQRNSKIEQ
jgi:hypothetical protein